MSSNVLDTNTVSVVLLVHKGNWPVSEYRTHSQLQCSTDVKVVCSQGYLSSRKTWVNTIQRNLVAGILMEGPGTGWFKWVSAVREGAWDFQACFRGSDICFRCTVLIGSNEWCYDWPRLNHIKDRRTQNRLGIFTTKQDDKVKGQIAKRDQAVIDHPHRPRLQNWLQRWEVREKAGFLVEGLSSITCLCIHVPLNFVSVLVMGQDLMTFLCQSA